MKNIILTITDRHHHFAYDIEVPAAEGGRKLMEDVMEVLDQYNRELNFNPLYHCLYLNRLGRVMREDESLGQAGIRNGDYITVISRV